MSTGSKMGAWIEQGKIARKINKPIETIKADMKVTRKDPITSIPARRGIINDPSKSIAFKAAQRRRKPKITPEMSECLSFLTSTVGKPESEIKRLIKEFPLKDKLLQLVDHMIATGLGGWRKDGKHLVNESGHIASLENWEVTLGGHLKPIGGKEQVSFDVDKLLFFRGCVDE